MTLFDFLERTLLPKKVMKVTGLVHWIGAFPENEGKRIGFGDFLIASIKMSIVIYVITPIAILIAIATNMRFSWSIALSVLAYGFLICFTVCSLVNVIFAFLWNRRQKRLETQ